LPLSKTTIGGYAIRANARNGLRLTAKDRRRAVEELLGDEEWRKWSDRQIARHCGVDHKTVGVSRARLQGNGEIPQSAKRMEVRAGRVRERIVKTRSGGANLTPRQVADIRADPRNGQEMADLYGISKSLVSKIRSNDIYFDPEYVPAFAGLRRAWDHAGEEEKFARWLWSEHREMIEAVITEPSPQSEQRAA
jgi:hypothetical protein